VFSYSFAFRPAPVPVGISLALVARDHRCKGIGLDAMSQTLSYAFPLDPVKGQIAFSQPTGNSSRLMVSWGNGKVRVYDELKLLQFPKSDMYFSSHFYDPKPLLHGPE
jgi:hypothetical protein